MLNDANKSLKNKMKSFIYQSMLGLLGVTLGLQAHASSAADVYGTAYADTRSQSYISARLQTEQLSTQFSGQQGSANASQPWRGFGIENAVGMIYSDTLVVELAHTYRSQSSKDRPSENLLGSQLSLRTGLSFRAPWARLDLGGAVFVREAAYQRDSERSSLSGSGYQVSAGLRSALAKDLQVELRVFQTESQLSGDLPTDQESSGLRMRGQGVSIGFTFMR